MTNVNIFAEGITLETMRDELRQQPWRLDERSVYGNTPLMSAAMFGNVAVVEFLLSLGANMEAKDDVCLYIVCRSFACMFRKCSDIILLHLRTNAETMSVNAFSPSCFFNLQRPLISLQKLFFSRYVVLCMISVDGVH